MKENEIGGLPMAEHILVGLSSAPSNARIIRTAATISKTTHIDFGKVICDFQ